MCRPHRKYSITSTSTQAACKDWVKLQTFLKKKLFDKGLNTLQLWLPIEDRKTEDVWEDFYTREVVQNFTHPWIGSKPNGGRAENCARLMNENDWADRRCDYPNFACMCSHKSNTNLKLRGLCPRSAIDVHYKPVNKQTDIREMKLQGLKHTSIGHVRNDIFSFLKIPKAEKKWVLHVIDPKVTGTSTAPFTSFTLGKHNWTIRGDEGCSSKDSYNTELKMSGCAERNFTCDDGQCVSMDMRCNQFPECRDKSDEKNCKILLLEEGYNKKVPPVTSTDPVNVSISIDVLKLVDINEEDYSIEIQFEIRIIKSIIKSIIKIVKEAKHPT